MKIPRMLITGGAGFIAQEFRAAFSDAYEISAPGRDTCDVTNSTALGRVIDDAKPDIVLHLAGLVNKLRCERFPGLAAAVNAEGTRNVAEAAAKRRLRLVCLSTDFVFGGEAERPYTEEDATRPVNVYGRTKLDGERHAREICPETLIVRTSRVFGAHGSNFVSSLPALVRTEQTLRVAGDVRSGVTFAPDLARALDALIRKDASGVLHVANSGDCTPAEFSASVSEEIGGAAHLETIPYNSLDYPVPSPAYCALDTRKYAALGFPPLRPWRDALKEFLRNAG